MCLVELGLICVGVDTFPHSFKVKGHLHRCTLLP